MRVPVLLYRKLNASKTYRHVAVCTLALNCATLQKFSVPVFFTGNGCWPALPGRRLRSPVRTCQQAAEAQYRGTVSWAVLRTKHGHGDQAPTPAFGGILFILAGPRNQLLLVACWLAAGS